MSLWIGFVLLAVAGWVVPWLLSKLLPEGIVWLFVIGAVSAVLLAGLSAAVFYVSYGAAGRSVLAEAPWHFVVLAGRSALIWGPVMALSVANQPRRWKTAIW